MWFVYCALWDAVNTEWRVTLFFYVILLPQFIKIWIVYDCNLNTLPCNCLLTGAIVINCIFTSDWLKKQQLRKGKRSSPNNSRTVVYEQDPRESVPWQAACLQDRSQSHLYYVCNIAICIAPVSLSTTEHRFTGGVPASEGEEVIRGPQERNRRQLCGDSDVTFCVSICMLNSLYLPPPLISSGPRNLLLPFLSTLHISTSVPIVRRFLIRRRLTL